jgi:hypothetical protein
MRVDTDHWRQRLRGIADMVENAQGVVDLETAQRFEALFGLRVPAQATLVRVTAAIREGERRRMLAVGAYDRGDCSAWGCNRHS